MERRYREIDAHGDSPKPTLGASSLSAESNELLVLQPK